MGLSTTSLLTIVAIMFCTADKLPVLNVPTSLDVFYFTSEILILLVVFWCGWANWLSDITRGHGSKSGKLMRYKLAYKIDGVLMYIFPVAYAIFLFQTYSVMLGAGWTDTTDVSAAASEHGSGAGEANTIA